MLTDELGDGLVFILRRINDMPNQNSGGYPNLDVPPFLPNPGEFRSDFFQVRAERGVPNDRTGGANSLFRNPADADGSNSQWDNTVRAFAVSQYNRQPIQIPGGSTNKELRADTYGIVLGSAEGNVYRSQNSGIDWFVVGNSTIFNDSPTTALEFGAPVPNANNPRNDNDHIYVGTEEGRIWVTESGGGRGLQLEGDLGPGWTGRGC